MNTTHGLCLRACSVGRGEGEAGKGGREERGERRGEGWKRGREERGKERRDGRKRVREGERGGRGKGWKRDVENYSTIHGLLSSPIHAH